MSLVILRLVAALALIALLWNPTSSRALAAGDQPLVLLDGSLSMSGPGDGAGPWRAALDSARALARRGALVWRFGSAVTGFDSAPPLAGTSRLGPALEAAAARAGPVVVLTDGAVDDTAAIPPDVLRRARIVVLPRATFHDAYVASVQGARHVTRGDTLRLRVSYGTAGPRDARVQTGRLVVSARARRLMTQSVTLPDSGILQATVVLPASRFFGSGWQVLEVRLDGVQDAEPRDDARLFAVDVSSVPAAVVLASPPDWESRFLARAITEVARVPVKEFVEAEAGRWRDAATLAPVAERDVARAASGARLIVATGDTGRERRFLSGDAARLLWPAAAQSGVGDWYVERPPSSPFTAALSGIDWDSLPPATAVDVSDDSVSGIVALTARLARRGPARPIVTLTQQGATRTATVSATGLWRWAFRGGESEQAYRTLVAAVVDWLLGQPGAGRRERAVPETFEVPNGLPLVWRWSAPDTATPHDLTVTLRAGDTTRVDTLRFDAAGRAELLLPPGVYRYALRGGSEQGVVAVETYSAEFVPRAPAVRAQPGEAAARRASIGLRDRWWLFALAIAALAAEWTLRRRQGLP